MTDFAVPESANLIFGKFQPSKGAKMLKSQNSEPQNVLKWQILHFKNPQN